jgi:hypothetical protein
MQNSWLMMQASGNSAKSKANKLFMYMKVQRMHLAYQKFKCFFKEDIF